MKYFVIFALLSIVFLSTTLVPSASSQAMCMGADEAFHFWVNDISFIGTVSEINPSNNTDRYDYITFDIKYPLKGLGNASDFTVATYQGGSYSYDFKIDSAYLVHASERKGVKYFTDLCSANQLLKTDTEVEQMKNKMLEVQSIPPLKLKQYGIASHEIKCKDGLVLVQKYNGTPACVTEPTKQKLIERGWTANNYKTTTDSPQWKKYITISATRNDNPEFAKVLPVYKIHDKPNSALLQTLLVGADGCKNETKVCRISHGVSIDRTYPFIPSGINISDNDKYTITLDESQAESILPILDWQREDDSFYSVIHWDNKQYFLVLSTFDHKNTPDVKMDILGTLAKPIALQKGQTLNYTITINAWSTYGTDAQIDLVARQDSVDSGITAWIEPSTFFVKERSNATAILFIQAQDSAQDGLYDIRVIGKANGKNANLYCSPISCPLIRIGDSEWSIQNFGSNAGRWVGSGNPPQNTWMELELNKDKFFKGDAAEIKAYLINNNTESLEFFPRELIISVINAEPVGYYGNLFGINAVYESDEPIIVEPDSKTILARTFYWNQTTFQDIDDQQRLEPKQYKMIARFVGGNHTWDDSIWFEIENED